MFESKLPNLGTSIFSQMTALANKHQALNLSQGFPEFDAPELLKKQLIASKRKAVLVLGKTEENKKEEIGNLKVVSHLNAKSLNQQMVNANVVISRSGYSTVMDIAKLHKKAIFVPTLGQTEQLYLAKYFYDKNRAFAMHQKELDIQHALQEVENVTPLKSDDYEVNWQELLSLFESK